jgi:uncharacterized repeat protein (TIGR02543 family)
VKGAEELKNGVVSILLVVTLALSIGHIGCAGEYAPGITEYALTVSGTDGGNACVPRQDCTCGEGTEDSGGGLNVPEECICAEGTEVSIEATPEPGYHFAGWTGDVDTIADVNAPKTTIMMNDNYSVTANFYEMPATYYTLTIAVSGNGSTSPSAGQHIYAAGSLVPITATPASGYRFVIWTGSTGTVANVVAATTTITVNADYTITANFEEGAATLPGSDVGVTVRGGTKEEGYIFPSDLQRHSFFTGTT